MKIEPVFISLLNLAYRCLLPILLSSCFKENPPTPGLDCNKFVLTVEVKPATCEAGASVTADGVGGVGTLIYLILDGPTSNSGIFTNLEPGDYVIRAVDAVGCSNELEITIIPPEAASLEKVIMPLILTNCSMSMECHSKGALSGELVTPANVISQAVKIQDALSDEFQHSKTLLMQEEVNLINCWINSGAPDN